MNEELWFLEGFPQLDASKAREGCSPHLPPAGMVMCPGATRVGNHGWDGYADKSYVCLFAPAVHAAVLVDDIVLINQWPVYLCMRAHVRARVRCARAALIMLPFLLRIRIYLEPICILVRIAFWL